MVHLVGDQTESEGDKEEVSETERGQVEPHVSNDLELCEEQVARRSVRGMGESGAEQYGAVVCLRESARGGGVRKRGR